MWNFLEEGGKLASPHLATGKPVTQLDAQLRTWHEL